MQDDANAHALELETSVRVLRRRAALAIIGLSGALLARAYDCSVLEWSITLIRTIPDTGAGPELQSRLEFADSLVNAGNTAIWVGFAAAAILFLRWMHRLVGLTRALGGELSWSPSDAVVAFILPLVCLFRPYQILSAVGAALEPEKVPAPAPRVDPAAQGDYRSVAFIEPPPPRKLPQALLGLWWGAWLVTVVGARLLQVGASTTPTSAEAVIGLYQRGMFVSFIAVVAAGLAITVVRGLTALAEERYRRLYG